MRKANQPILVTGSHRSGTTWAGRTLALAPRTGYIHEPFNVEIPNHIIDNPLCYWFQYICEENENKFKASIDKVIHYQYPLLGNLNKAGSITDLGEIIRDQSLSLFFSIGRTKPIVKDPIAFFSAEWLSKTYGMNVLVMIRHPAAFCSSLKMKDWNFDFNNFLNQPLLMDRYLASFEKEIRDFAKEERCIIDQGILLWNCIHHTVKIYMQNHSEWMFVRHEDLSDNPLENYELIFQKFDLKFTSRVKKGILESSGSHNPTEPLSDKPSDELKRNSKENIKNWKKRLSPEEIETIRSRTNELSNTFYKEHDW